MSKVTYSLAANGWCEGGGVVQSHLNVTEIFILSGKLKFDMFQFCDNKNAMVTGLLFDF